jgi:cytoskeletal protein RodZ
MVNKKQDCVLVITPNCVNKEKIDPNPSPSDNTTDKPSSNNKMLTIIIISCVAFLLIIILVVIFILIYKFKKNKDLSDEVNKISFQDNNKEEDDENGDTLLE